VSTAGRHLIAEYWGCAASLDDPTALEAALRAAASAARANVLHALFHRFSPHGVTGVLLIEESHLSIHTWPESGYAAVDLYTCGEADPRVAHEVLVAALRASESTMVILARGEGLAPRVILGAFAETPSSPRES
jgi:S-adenosylmethionine decarboxylase proenzyme